MPARHVLVGMVLLGSSLVPALRAQDTRFEFTQLHMGMEVRVVLYAGDSSLASRAARAAFARIRKLEDTMSDYRDESEVRRLSLRPREWVPVSAELFTVLGAALSLAERSNGAFDPTIGPLVRLWRESRRSGERPSAASLAAAREGVDWRFVSLDSIERRVRLAKPGMLLDLGGIAKGYILDQALAAIRSSGVSRALIVAGGDIVAGDSPPGAKGWRVEVPRASEAMRERAALLNNAALATSGDQEQFIEIGGIRYSHVLDPRTGAPLTQGRRAYVIAPAGVTADGLATTLTVTTASEARGLLLHYGAAFAEVIPLPSH